MADVSISSSRVLPGARTALLLLLAINLFNYIDRQILAAVLPKLQLVYLSGDENASTKLGLLTTAFIVSYIVIAPLFGWLGDRMSRWLLIAIGVIIWSLASGGSGLAAGFTILLVTRCFVGIGEAAYGPIAPTLLSDYFPVRIRGRVMAVFYAAIPVGGALGYVLGGQVDKHLGWQWAFYMVVPPGILLGIWCLFMREPGRVQSNSFIGFVFHSFVTMFKRKPGQVTSDPAGASKPTELSDAEAAESITAHRPRPLLVSKPQSQWREYLSLFKIPSFVLDTLGMTAMSFAIGGLAVWMPYYILHREGRCTITEQALVELKSKSSVPSMPDDVADKLRGHVGRTMKYTEFVEEMEKTLGKNVWLNYSNAMLNICCTPSLGDINLIFGAIVVVSGLAATLLGGWIADALRSRFSGSYFLVSGLSMLISCPMLLLMVYVDDPLARWICLFLAVFFLFFNTGPTNTILANVTSSAVRARAYSVNILIIHGLGDAISPPIMGALADWNGWDFSLACVSFVVVLGSAFWLLGVTHLGRDTETASLAG